MRRDIICRCEGQRKQTSNAAVRRTSYYRLIDLTSLGREGHSRVFFAPKDRHPLAASFEKDQK